LRGRRVEIDRKAGGRWTPDDGGCAEFAGALLKIVTKSCRHACDCAQVVVDGGIQVMDVDARYSARDAARLPPTRLEVAVAAVRGGQPRPGPSPGRRGRMLYARLGSPGADGSTGGVDGFTQPANWMVEIYAEMTVLVCERT
jgi:hypothetical protein